MADDDFVINKSVTLLRVRRLRHEPFFGDPLSLFTQFREIVTFVILCHNVLIGNCMARNHNYHVAAEIHRSSLPM